MILQFQKEAAKWFGPERWAVGWVVRSDSSTIRRSIFLRKEHSVRKQFSHLMSNIIQGETKRSTPLILCLDEARLEGSRGGPKGSKQI